MSCSQCCGLERQFDDAHALRNLRRFRRKGPAKATRWLLGAVAQDGVEGRTFIDVGGGIGAIQHELMARGAAGGAHSDAAPAFLRAARSEAEARGYADRMRYVDGDFVERARQLPAADLVTLDRVVCCYPDMPALLGAAVWALQAGAWWWQRRWLARQGLEPANARRLAGRVWWPCLALLIIPLLELAWPWYGLGLGPLALCREAWPLAALAAAGWVLIQTRLAPPDMLHRQKKNLISIITKVKQIVLTGPDGAAMGAV